MTYFTPALSRWLHEGGRPPGPKTAAILGSRQEQGAARMAARDPEVDLPATRRQPPLGTMSYEEFLDWCDEDTLAEWVRGRVIMTSPASLRHQELLGFLLIVLHFWVRAHDL